MFSRNFRFQLDPKSLLAQNLFWQERIVTIVVISLFFLLIINLFEDQTQIKLKGDCYYFSPHIPHIKTPQRT